MNTSEDTFSGIITDVDLPKVLGRPTHMSWCPVNNLVAVAISPQSLKPVEPASTDKYRRPADLRRPVSGHADSCNNPPWELDAAFSASEDGQSPKKRRGYRVSAPAVSSSSSIKVLLVDPSLPQELTLLVVPGESPGPGGAPAEVDEVVSLEWSLAGQPRALLVATQAGAIHVFTQAPQDSPDPMEDLKSGLANARQLQVRTLRDWHSAGPVAQLGERLAAATFLQQYRGVGWSREALAEKMRAEPPPPPQSQAQSQDDATQGTAGASRTAGNTALGGLSKESLNSVFYDPDYAKHGQTHWARPHQLTIAALTRRGTLLFFWRETKPCTGRAAVVATGSVSVSPAVARWITSQPLHLSKDIFPPAPLPCGGDGGYEDAASGDAPMGEDYAFPSNMDIEPSFFLPDGSDSQNPEAVGPSGPLREGSAGGPSGDFRDRGSVEGAGGPASVQMDPLYPLDANRPNLSLSLSDVGTPFTQSPLAAKNSGASSSGIASQDGAGTALMASSLKDVEVTVHPDSCDIVVGCTSALSGTAEGSSPSQGIADGARTPFGAAGSAQGSSPNGFLSTDAAPTDARLDGVGITPSNVSGGGFAATQYGSGAQGLSMEDPMVDATPEIGSACIGASGGAETYLTVLEPSQPDTVRILKVFGDPRAHAWLLDSAEAGDDAAGGLRPHKDTAAAASAPHENDTQAHMSGDAGAAPPDTALNLAGGGAVGAGLDEAATGSGLSQVEGSPPPVSSTPLLFGDPLVSPGSGGGAVAGGSSSQGSPANQPGGGGAGNTGATFPSVSQTPSGAAGDVIGSQEADLLPSTSPMTTAPSPSFQPPTGGLAVGFITDPAAPNTVGRDVAADRAAATDELAPQGSPYGLNAVVSIYLRMPEGCIARTCAFGAVQYNMVIYVCCKAPAMEPESGCAWFVLSFREQPPWSSKDPVMTDWPQGAFCQLPFNIEDSEEPPRMAVSSDKSRLTVSLGGYVVVLDSQTLVTTFVLSPPMPIPPSQPAPLAAGVTDKEAVGSEMQEEDRLRVPGRQRLPGTETLMEPALPNVTLVNGWGQSGSSSDDLDLDDFLLLYGEVADPCRAGGSGRTSKGELETWPAAGPLFQAATETVGPSDGGSQGTKDAVSLPASEGGTDGKGNGLQGTDLKSLDGIWSSVAVKEETAGEAQAAVQSDALSHALSGSGQEGMPPDHVGSDPAPKTIEAVDGIDVQGTHQMAPRAVSLACLSPNTCCVCTISFTLPAPLPPELLEAAARLPIVSSGANLPKYGSAGSKSYVVSEPGVSDLKLEPGFERNQGDSESTLRPPVIKVEEGSPRSFARLACKQEGVGLELGLRAMPVTGETRRTGDDALSLASSGEERGVPEQGIENGGNGGAFAGVSGVSKSEEDGGGTRGPEAEELCPAAARILDPNGCPGAKPVNNRRKRRLEWDDDYGPDCQADAGGRIPLVAGLGSTDRLGALRKRLRRPDTSAVAQAPATNEASGASSCSSFVANAARRRLAEILRVTAVAPRLRIQLLQDEGLTCLLPPMESQMTSDGALYGAEGVGAAACDPGVFPPGMDPMGLSGMGLSGLEVSMSQQADVPESCSTGPMPNGGVDGDGIAPHSVTLAEISSQGDGGIQDPGTYAPSSQDQLSGASPPMQSPAGSAAADFPLPSASPAGVLLSQATGPQPVSGLDDQPTGWASAAPLLAPEVPAAAGAAFLGTGDALPDDLNYPALWDGLRLAWAVVRRQGSWDVAERLQAAWRAGDRRRVFLAVALLDQLFENLPSSGRQSLAAQMDRVKASVLQRLPDSAEAESLLLDLVLASKIRRISAVLNCSANYLVHFSQANQAASTSGKEALQSYFKACDPCIVTTMASALSTVLDTCILVITSYMVYETQGRHAKKLFEREYNHKRQQQAEGDPAAAAKSDDGPLSVAEAEEVRRYRDRSVSLPLVRLLSDNQFIRDMNALQQTVSLCKDFLQQAQMSGCGAARFPELLAHSRPSLVLPPLFDVLDSTTTALRNFFALVRCSLPGLAGNSTHAASRAVLRPLVSVLGCGFNLHYISTPQNVRFSWSTFQGLLQLQQQKQQQQLQQQQQGSGGALQPVAAATGVASGTTLAPATATMVSAASNGSGDMSPASARRTQDRKRLADELNRFWNSAKGDRLWALARVLALGGAEEETAEQSSARREMAVARRAFRLWTPPATLHSDAGGLSALRPAGPSGRRRPLPSRLKVLNRRTEIVPPSSRRSSSEDTGAKAPPRLKVELDSSLSRAEATTAVADLVKGGLPAPTAAGPAVARVKEELQGPGPIVEASNGAGSGFAGMLRSSLQSPWPATELRKLLVRWQRRRRNRWRREERLVLGLQSPAARMKAAVTATRRRVLTHLSGADSSPLSSTFSDPALTQQQNSVLDCVTGGTLWRWPDRHADSAIASAISSTTVSGVGDGGGPTSPTSPTRSRNWRSALVDSALPSTSGLGPIPSAAPPKPEWHADCLATRELWGGFVPRTALLNVDALLRSARYCHALRSSGRPWQDWLGLELISACQKAWLVSPPPLLLQGAWRPAAAGSGSFEEGDLEEDEEEEEEDEKEEEEEEEEALEEEELEEEEEGSGHVDVWEL